MHDTDYSDDDRANYLNRVVHSSLSTKVFLPWDASVVLYGFQAYFRHDATEQDLVRVGTEESTQHWDMQIDITHAHPDGRQFVPSLYTLLPRTRADNSFTEKAHHAHEEYWPYVTKQNMITGTKKGHFAITASIWAKIDSDSYADHKEKLLTPTGAVWILAIR